MRTNIQKCSRCGTNHERVEVRPFTNPPSAEVGESQPIATHFAECPLLREPILIVMDETPE